MEPDVTHLFPRPAAPRTARLGVEQELFAGRVGDHAVVPVSELRWAAERRLMPGVLSFEPGGQVELSLCPGAPSEVADACAGQVGRLTTALAAAGIEVAGGAVDPWRAPCDIPMQLDSARYLAMQAHLDRIGPAGRVMMRATASTQVCADWWPGLEGLQQWRLAHLIGPPLAAWFADSRPGARGIRLTAWLAVDPARCAWDDRMVLTDEPEVAYAAFAAGAGTFAMPGDEDPDNGSLSWREWRLSRGDRPGAVAHHLSTLFPPVRPRGRYLELRYLDGQSPQDLAVLLAVVSVALHDETTRRTLLDLLAPSVGGLEERWRRAATPWPDPDLLADAAEILAVAADGLRSAPARVATGATRTRLAQHLQRPVVLAG